MTISVLILTKNESPNLPGAIASVLGHSDDIVIFDSFSTDDTIEIARNAGARTFQRKFDNFAAQRNAALMEVEFKHDWILILDADERVTSEFWKELPSFLRDDSLTMLRLRRKDFFLGRWLRRSSGYPTWFTRVVRRGMVHVQRSINEEFVTSGRTARMTSHFNHFPFNRGVAYWIERHNMYSTLEAMLITSASHSHFALRDFLSRDPVARRRSHKALAHRLPLRPLFVFIYLYIFRLGLLDGLPGYYFCCLRASYELLIDVKTAEADEKSGSEATFRV